jgi:type VI protein secretion system component Hcp
MRDIQILIRCFAVACVATSASAIVTRGAEAQAQADRIIATITHPTLGAIPPAPCATSPVVSSFDETTSANGPTQGGTFSVEIQSTCIAAFAQAAAQGTRLSAQFAYMSGNTPIMTYTLTNAFIAQVSLALVQSSSGLMPVTRIVIGAPQVSVTYPKPKDAAVAQASKTTEPARSKAPAFRVRSLALASTSGESWATGGVHATMTAATDNPAMNATFPVTDFHIVYAVLNVVWINQGTSWAPSPGNAMTMPRPSTYLDFTKGIDASSGQLHTASQTHATLKTVTFTLTGSRGTAGITVNVGGPLCSDQVNGTSETLSFSGSVTVTDMGSGRKIAFASGKSPGGSVYAVACS